MNIKKYLLAFLVLIIYYWAICLAQSNHNLKNHTESHLLSNPGNDKDKQQINTPKLPRQAGKCTCQESEPPNDSKNNCLVCKCNCDTANIHSSIISTINNIVRNILRGIDLMLIAFRDNFDNLAILMETPGIIGVNNNEDLSLGSLLNEYNHVNKTVSHIMDIFRKFFGGEMGRVSNPVKFITDLNDRITRWLRRLMDMRFPHVHMLSNITNTIQRNVNDMMAGFLNNPISLPNISLMNLINHIPFIRKNNSSSIIHRKHELNMSREKIYQSAIIELLSGRINIQDFILRLRNETMKVHNNMNTHLPRMWDIHNLTGIMKNINSIWWPNLPRTNAADSATNWTKLISDLRTSMISVHNIPLYIIELFRTIRESLMPSRIIKNHWDKMMKNNPLFLAESCSSRLEKLYESSRYKPPSMCDRISNRCRYRHLSLWNKLKLKLFDQFQC